MSYAGLIAFLSVPMLIGYSIARLMSRPGASRWQAAGVSCIVGLLFAGLVAFKIAFPSSPDEGESEYGVSYRGAAID